jgi:two-component sensor histidine kinase
MPLGLLVNECMTNSFKHAFNGRPQGVITLECLRNGSDRCRVAVADDGTGLAEGTAWPIPGKISTLFVQTLRENARAELSMQSTPGSGTRVTIDLDRKTAKPD